MILNLVNKEESQIKYELIYYPDGQQDIKLDISTIRFEGIDIKARLRNFSDLEVIVCTCKALNNMGIPGQAISLEIPYLLGSRSDRKFVEGGTSYLRDVIAPIINSLALSVVKVMDVHSDVSEAVINNLFNISNKKLVEYAINDVYGLNGASEAEDIKKAHDKIVLVSFNERQYNKLSKTCKSLDYKGLKFNYNNGITSNDFRGKDFFIIIDIFDNITPIVGISNSIKSMYGLKSNVFLICTHCINNEEYLNLQNAFNCIYSTDSFSVLEASNFKQLSIF